MNAHRLFTRLQRSGSRASSSGKLQPDQEARIHHKPRPLKPFSNQFGRFVKESLCNLCEKIDFKSRLGQLIYLSSTSHESMQKNAYSAFTHHKMLIIHVFYHFCEISSE